MQSKAITAICLVSITVAGCSSITNPFQNRRGEYLNSKEHPALIVEKHLKAKNKSARYAVPGGEDGCGADESLIAPPA